MRSHYNINKIMTFDDFCNGVLKEAIFSSGIKKTWASDSASNSWDGNIELDGKEFYVEVEYDFDFTYDRGDNMTPPDTRIDDFRFTFAKVYQENPGTGDYDIEITADTNPELFKAVLLKTEEKVVENEYERL